MADVYADFIAHNARFVAGLRRNADALRRQQQAVNGLRREVGAFNRSAQAMVGWLVSIRSAVNILAGSAGLGLLVKRQTDFGARIEAETERRTRAAHQQIELLKAEGAERLRLQAQFEVENQLADEQLRITRGLETARGKARDQLLAEQAALKETVEGVNKLVEARENQLRVETEAQALAQTRQRLTEANLAHRRDLFGIRDRTRQLEREAQATRKRIARKPSADPERLALEATQQRGVELARELSEAEARFKAGFGDAAEIEALKLRIRLLVEYREASLKLFQAQAKSLALNKAEAVIKANSLEAHKKAIELQIRELENANKLAGLSGIKLIEQQQSIALDAKKAEIHKAIKKAKDENNVAAREVLKAEFRKLDRADALKEKQRGQLKNLLEQKKQIELAKQVSATLGKGIENLILMTQSWKDTLKQVLASLVKIAVQQLVINQITGFFRGLFGGRAAGGPVQSGRSYLVGERGPELFRPNTSGRIIPHHRLAAAAAGAGSGAPAFNFSIHIESTDGPGVRAALAEAVPVIEARVSQSVRGQVAADLSRPSPLRGLTRGG